MARAGTGTRALFAPSGVSAVVAVVAMVVLAACTSESGRPAVTSGSAPEPSGTRGSPGPARNDLTGIGGQPVGLAFAYGSVWVTAAGSNEVMRIDAATGDIVGQVQVGDTPLRLVATPHGIWVSEFRAGTVALLDPAGTVVARVPVGAQPEGLATDGTHLWVVLQQASQLAELDAATGSRLRTVLLPSGGEPRLAAYAPAAPGRLATVWVTDFGADRLVPVDAADGRVETAVAACPGPQALAVSGGTLWVACLSGRLVAVDLVTRRVRGTVDLSSLEGAPDAVTVAGGKVYVAMSTGPAVLSVDPARLRVTALSRLGSSGPLTNADVDVLVVMGQVWVTSWNEQGVHHDPVGSLGPPP